MNDAEIEKYLKANKTNVFKRLSEYLMGRGYPGHFVEKVQKSIWSWEADSCYDLIDIVSSEYGFKESHQEDVEALLHEYEMAFTATRAFSTYKKAYDDKRAIIGIIKEVKSLFD